MTSTATGQRAVEFMWAGIRAAGLLALALALVLTSGCGVSLFHGPADVTQAPLVPGAVKVPDDIEGTRARIALEPNEAFWHYRLGVLHSEAGSPREAEAALRAAIALVPAHAASLALLSRVCFAAGRHAEAIRDLEAARAAFPAGMPAALLEGLALHYDAVDRIEDARATLAAAPEGDRGGSARVYLKLRGDVSPETDALAAETAKLGPKSAANQNNLGIARLRGGDPDAAARAFEKAIDIDPALPGPYYNMAILEKFYRFDDAAAARWFGRYRERASADPDGLAGLIGGDDARPIAERKD
jgi:tetratricopeptide (TPR) repeat protein